jgi:hypothetical protein
MPIVGFYCPDGHPVKLQDCFTLCRMGKRCATLSFLRLVGYDREWRGVTPSMAGNGPRLEYLKRTRPYCVDPEDRVFAALGVGVHGKLAIGAYNDNILSEEPLKDNKTKGIPDCLEPDEEVEDAYVLTDFKTFGSYKVAKAIGIAKHTKEIPILNDGKPVLLKSGPNKGKPKTKKEHTFTIDPSKADYLETVYQLNRYRILFEQSGFPISRMQVQACVRDGGTYVAEGRGITSNKYLIPIPYMPDHEVLAYYAFLESEIQRAMKTGYARKCNAWESWDGRRCEDFCSVYYWCEEMGE